MEVRDGHGLFVALPPQPKRRKTEMRLQASIGCATVVLITSCCVAATEFGARSMDGWAPHALLSVSRCLVYIAALVAFGCLMGLMFGDPGVIKRSESTCLPVPPSILEKINASERVDFGANIVENGLTYCVRCLVWRIPGSSGSDLECCSSAQVWDWCNGTGNRIHHCDTCQRCVEHFDHHCGVFGRCIAGQGFGGNMGYFKTILAMGNLGGAVSSVFLCGGLSQVGNAGMWVAVIFVGYLGLYCVAGAVVLCIWGIYACMKRRREWSSLPADEGASGPSGLVIGRSENVSVPPT